MEELKIKATKSTPEITMDMETNHMILKGRSLPENTRQFYEQVKAWLNDYSPPEGSAIVLDVEFTYVSSSSLIALLSLIKQLRLHLERGCSLKVNWMYEKFDEDMLSIGEDIQHLSDVHFEYIEVPE